MNISEGCMVSIHYTLTNDGGEILDTSDGGDPLSYLHGYGGMIPGLEKALEDRSAGDVNANHPMAGVALHFDVAIVSVRAATDEEIAEGRAV